MAIQEILKELFEAKGHSVYQAYNGKEALQVLDENPMPGFILLDLMMPVMDGTTFLKTMRLNSRFSKLPVVIFSAGRKTIDEPVDAFIDKPPKIDDLLALAKKYCS